MKPLGIVLFSGPYGSGKTRLVARVAAAAPPETQPAAVLLQTGPVNLDPLWLPGCRVVTLEGICQCGAGDELAESVRLLVERGAELVLVELAGEQDASLAVAAVAELDAPVAVLPASEEPPDLTPAALLERYGVDPTGPGEGGAESTSCGCADDHCGHVHAVCGCGEARLDPQWMPFWYPDSADEASLMQVLGALPEGVLRVKGVQHAGEDRWLLVDTAQGRASRRELTTEELPELFDLDALGADQPLNAQPPSRGALLLVWARAADQAASVSLEFALSAALDECYGARAAPEDDMAEATAAVQDPDLVLEALAVARRAARELDDRADPVELLALCYHELSESGRALTLLQEAQRRDPTHLSARLNAARLHLSFDDAESALPLAAAVVADDPEDPEHQLVYGEALLQTGQGDAALPHLERAAAGLSDDDVLRSVLCNLYAERSEYRRALQYNSEVLSLDPQDDGALYLRGELLLRLQRPQEALESLEQALALGNETPWVLIALGVAHEVLQENDQATGCFADAFVLAQEQLDGLPEDGAAMDLLLAAAFRGRLDQVPELWDRLGQLDPQELSKARDTLALAPERGEATRVLEAIDRILD